MGAIPVSSAALGHRDAKFSVPFGLIPGQDNAGLGMVWYVAAREGALFVVVGAGLTGLSAGLHMAREGPRIGKITPVRVFERERAVGGMARSHRRAGYIFDITGHWLHSTSDVVSSLLEEIFAPGDLVEIERRTGVYTHGVMLPFPFQANLHGLPTSVVRRCLEDFRRAYTAQEPPTSPTFEAFAVARFGRAMADTFFIPYNRKLWGESFDHLSSHHIARFVPHPDLEQVERGAAGQVQTGLGYNARFLYPASGGIGQVAERLANRLCSYSHGRLDMGAELLQLDVERRVALFSGQPPVTYSRLISTIPLPMLIDRIVQAPSSVREARARLRWVPWRYLDIATRHSPSIAEHWVYVPDPAVPFFRVGIYSNVATAMAPKGSASIYVELADRSSAPNLELIAQELQSMGVLRDVNDIVWTELRDLDCAYVVFDEHYEDARRVLLEWLDSKGILSCGRYGAWVYNSMSECLLSGIEAAQRVMVEEGGQA